LRAVVHCFTGTLEEAKNYMKYENVMLGLTATCTHGNDRGARLREILETKVIPLERLMIGMFTTVFFFLFCAGEVKVESFSLLGEFLFYCIYFLITETDAPFMTPHNIPSSFNHHSDRNDPSLLWCVCDTLSKIYSVTPEVIAEHTTNNSLNFFGISL
jgi:TatD DNase family protein